MKAQTAARQCGLSYSKKGPREIRAWFGHLAGVRSGTFKHFMTGRLDDRSLTVFESVYLLPAGNAMIPVAYVHYILEAPNWPKLVVKRRRWKLVRALFGKRDTQQFEDGEFQRRCSVTTDEPDFALVFLVPEVQAHIASKPEVTWQAGSHTFAMTYSGMLKPAKLGASIERLRRMWALVPDHVKDWELDDDEPMPVLQDLT